MRGEGRRPPWALAVACTTAAILACCGDAGGGGSASARGPLQVPMSWQTARLAAGHVVHVGEQRLACEQCHTTASQTFANPGPLPCVGCHLEQGRIEHASARAQARFGAAAQANCVDCHAFAAPAPADGAAAQRDAGSARPEWDCGRCHDGRRAEPGVTAVVAHRGAACSACHDPHADSAAAGDCAGCHADVALTHGGAARASSAAMVSVVPQGSGSVQARCQVCHRGLHEPAAASAGACVECHATMAPRVGARALFAGGHERCTSCHAPHAFEPARAVPCVSCHETQPAALASAKVPAHAACESCHSPHDARADARQACASCHRQVASDHPAAPGASACTTCHAAHPPAASGGARHAASARQRCANCHRQAGTDEGFHARGVACGECHAPHRFKLGAAELGACARCHASQTRRARQLERGHGACPACHAGLPHDTSAEPRACSTCHMEQSAAVSAGHRACQGCHEPHAGELTATCGSCHRPVLASAPAGHRACQGCHEPHSGALGVASCTGCHEDKREALHHDVQGGCGSCHAAHGPAPTAPPPCASCHQGARAMGLHAVPQHARCQECHGAHDAQPRPEPVACRSCHRDRAEHYPDARRCSGCHLFESL